MPKTRLALSSMGIIACRNFVNGIVKAARPEGEDLKSIITTQPHRLPSFVPGEPISTAPIKIGAASFVTKIGCRESPRMGEVGAADRSRLLRSKLAQLRCVNSVFVLI